MLLLLSRQNMVSWVCTQPIVALLELAVAVCVIIDSVCVLSGFTNPAVEGLYLAELPALLTVTQSANLLLSSNSNFLELPCK